MRETAGIRTLSRDIDLNNLYLSDGSVSYYVEGNTTKNYPVNDKGILTVNKADDKILQVYTTKKRIYKRYGTVQKYPIYGADKPINEEGVYNPPEIIGEDVQATFGQWYYEIYDKDTATETDYGLVTESRLKYLIDTYAPTYDATDIWNITNSKGNSIDLNNRILRSGDTLTGEHIYNSGLEINTGNVHFMSADIGLYRLSADSSYWIHIMHVDGGATLSLGGDEAETLYIIQNTASRPYIVSGQSGDVAYVEDLEWKMATQGFSRRDGTIYLSDYIPAVAKEVMLRFYTTYNGVNYISAYNKFPVHTGVQNWSTYHYGIAHIRVNTDTLIITNNSDNPPYPTGDFLPPGELMNGKFPVAYLYEVNWR